MTEIEKIRMLRERLDEREKIAGDSILVLLPLSKDETDVVRCALELLDSLYSYQTLMPHSYEAIDSIVRELDEL